ncbi:MAG TPA: SprT family zinc-dependent metalloprotease [Woeseiaceae bacterium]|nr:SprT family zinc-dependent metalloprotease [Woeseiaceae bacterium]
MRSTKRQLTLFPETAEPGNTPGFSVRKSMRAKRLTIKVFPGGRVEVVVPRRTRAAEVEAFVRDNAAWIRDARESFAVDQANEPFALPETIRLSAVGRKLTVRYQATPGATSVRYLLDGSRILLSGRIGDEKLCVQALRRCLAVVAKDELEPRLRSLSVRMNTPYKKSQIRAQRTCWGSRSGTGTVSLNLCLLFLEPAVMRYLMIHELCHGRHMNHSKRFWKLVGEFEPDYQRLDRKLTESWRRVPGWMGIY